MVSRLDLHRGTAAWSPSCSGAGSTGPPPWRLNISHNTYRTISYHSPLQNKIRRLYFICLKVLRGCMGLRKRTALLPTNFNHNADKILIRLRRIYNFWCSMIDYISVPHVFIMFLYYSGMIYGTNLLTTCPVSVPVFYCLFVLEKLFGEVSRNQFGNLRELFSRGIKSRARRTPVGGP